jgi:hypothetical protein
MQLIYMKQYFLFIIKYVYYNRVGYIVLVGMQVTSFPS